MLRLPRVLVLSLALAAAACATAARGGDTATPPGSGAPISREEALASGAGSAYDLVRSARPTWLRPRGSHSAQNPGGDVIWVYVNDSRIGGPEALQQIAVADVGSIRHYDMAAANYRFGQGHLNGAIQVIPAGASDSRHP